MDISQRMANLAVPTGKIDVIIDTDTYNEIDDQFAVSYLLKSDEKLNTKAIYAAPFLNNRSDSPKDGMEKSYNEILKLLGLIGRDVDTYKGSERFLENESTPVVSAAAEDLAERVKKYSPDKPLYIVAIGAITNIASAILINPDVAENAVLVWLGGHARHYHDTREFNMFQDVAAARVIMKSGIPLVQLPCFGVVSSFTISGPEFEYWFKGKNKLADYLADNAIKEAERYAKGRAWSRCIWDVTAVAWLLNDDSFFMLSRIEKTPIPTYDNYYAVNHNGLPMRYVYYIHRDRLLNDLIKKITE